jgi:hypothetical protein
MSLIVFLALCILGVDFLIYAFFQWIYGDKRNALNRQLDEYKNAPKERSPRPFLVASHQTGLRFPSLGMRGQSYNIPKPAKLAVDGQELPARRLRVH